MRYTVRFVGGPLDGQTRALPELPRTYEVGCYDARSKIITPSPPAYAIYRLMRSVLPNSIRVYKFEKLTDHPERVIEVVGR